MAGHSHAKNVMRKKQTEDKKRSAVFGKLLKDISITAREESNPDFNPRLRTAINKAKENNVPMENINRAIKGSQSESIDLEELLIEAYGPEGIAILIIAQTDNKNRTLPEIKSLLSKSGAKWAEPGSVMWAFLKNKTNDSWQATFPQDVSINIKSKLQLITSALLEHSDVKSVYTTAAN